MKVAPCNPDCAPLGELYLNASLARLKERGDVVLVKKNLDTVPAIMFRTMLGVDRFSLL